MFEPDRSRPRISEQASHLRLVAAEPSVLAAADRVGRRGKRSSILFSLAVIAVHPHFGDNCRAADDTPAGQGIVGRFDLLAQAQPLS